MHVAGIPHAYHDPNTVRCLRVCAIIHFGTDGWRARVDEDFTADNVARIADAVGELWQKTNPGKTVYIGFDTPLPLRGRRLMTVRRAARSW